MSNVVAIDEIRRSVEGADRAFPSDRTPGGNPPSPPASDSFESCPITPLGHFEGKYYFLDVCGHKRELNARALGNRHELLSLFHGSDRWLRKQFPKTKTPEPDESGKPVEPVVVDFFLYRAAEWLMQRCGTAGLYGDHIRIRVPGVWPTPEGLPAVHCGDAVLINGSWQPAGYRTGNNIWAAAPPVRRPDTPCEAAIAQQLQQDLQNYFNFRQAGGAVVALGLLGTALFGAAAKWRSAGFFLGPAGCGKSTLLEILAACCPLHEFSNDTTKAGLEQTLDGRAMPCFLDETEKTGDQRAASALLDMVLTASGARGTQGRRGGVDGRGRKIEMVGSIFMAATAPPDMKETHLGRFALVHLEKPVDGEDYRAQHTAIVERMRSLGPSIWGRALASFERYNIAVERFRAALGGVHCAPREMDQMGAILAGWWILTAEGAPDARGVATGLGAIPDFIRTTDIVAESSNARRLLHHLLTSAVQLDRSSAKDVISDLIMAVRDQGTDTVAGANIARHALATHGLRVIRKIGDEPVDPRSKCEAPRLGDSGGIWVNCLATELLRLVEGTEWSGSRLESGLRELPSARKAKHAVKVGSTVCKPVWVSFDDLRIAAPNEEASTEPITTAALP